MEKAHQLPLFPCERYITSRNVVVRFVDNVIRFKWFPVSEMHFLIKTTPNAEKEIVDRAFELGFVVKGSLGLKNSDYSIQDVANAIVAEEKFLAIHTCQLCDKPAEYHLECSCGTYIFCEYHMDRHPVVMDHADHECSPECCAKGHAPAHLQVWEPFFFYLEATKKEDILKATLKFYFDPPSLLDELY